MKSLLLSVMTVSLCGGAVGLLAPEDRDGSLKKQIRFVTALILCAVLFSPLLSVFGRTPSLTLPDTAFPTPAEDAAAPAILALAADTLCRELERYTAESLGVSRPSLVLTLDDSDLTAVRITGGTLTADGDPPEAAAAVLSELLGCPILAARGGEVTP